MVGWLHEPMPFTPFHFGPGLALASATRWINLVAFVAANVIIDLESGWNLLRDNYPVHGFFHSFVGASLAIPPAFLATMAVTALAERLGARLSLGPDRNRPLAIATGAVLGAWSHVALDAIMHSDLRPFSPWSQRNPLLGLLPIETLHSVCLAAGLVGALTVLVRSIVRRRRGP